MSWLPRVLPLLALVAAISSACFGDETATTGPDDRTAVARAVPTSAAPWSQTSLEATAVDLSDYDRPLTEGEEAMARRLALSFPGLDETIRGIDLSELRTGGPPKDGIPSLRGEGLSFVSAEAANKWLNDEEPVIALEVNGEARAYPLQILIWHEIANDVVGGVPVVVTFCPLCNSAIVFDARVDGVAREFRVSGLLRHSDLVMYDREEESLWQQITGEAIVGTHTGTKLTFLPSQIVSWAEFKEVFPRAPVLSRDTGHRRSYGVNPYAGYDRIGSSTLFSVKFDGRLDGKERVLTVELHGEAVAFPFRALSEAVVMETEVGGEPVVAFWQPGALSALDTEFIIGGRNVGSAGAFSPSLDSERLSFEARDGAIVDTKTGSTWNVLGRSVSGSLEGRELEPLVSGSHFWFAWSIFRPGTRVVMESGYRPSLVLYVSAECQTCEPAIALAERAQREFPGVKVNVFDLDAPSTSTTDVFVVPSFRLDDRAISLGTPSWGLLAAWLREALERETSTSP